MNIQICYASDNNYVKYLGVSIKSLIENTSDENNYYINIIDSGINETNKKKLQNFETNNCFIRFQDVKSLVEKYNINSLRISGHITIASYLRLLIPQIFSDLDKIIYLDCDVIVENDIAKLYQINIENYLFGAVKDIGLLYKKENKGINEKYFRNILGIKNCSDYFNAGVLLYNLAQMRQQNNNIFDVVNKIKKPLFHDQCYLNAFAKEKVFYLPFNWNLFGNFKYENSDYQKTFPRKYLEEFEQASQNPYIIHGKLWEFPDSDYAENFFRYARLTPFYESIIYENAIKKRKKKVLNFLGIKIKIKV